MKMSPLPEGSAEVYHSSGEIYKDLGELLTDAADTYAGYPGAEASLIDDPANSKTGVEICFQEDGLLHYWHFWISLQDIRKHADFEQLQSCTSRLSYLLDRVKKNHHDQAVPGIQEEDALCDSHPCRSLLKVPGV